MDIGAGFCMFAPAGTASEIIETIYTTLLERSRSAEFQTLMKDLGADVVLSDPGQFAKDVKSEVRRWKEFIPEVGIEKS